jgi:hypothetical protein
MRGIIVAVAIGVIVAAVGSIIIAHTVTLY